MDPDALDGTLRFLRSAERLKIMTRTAWTSQGKRESVAEHTWRLSLMALVLEDELEGVNMARLLKLCIVHDLGEAIGGDISAVLQPEEGKAEAERRDLLELLRPLPPSVREKITALWDEYEAAATPEARVGKALDKLETILQHNQGQNPPDFDYAFNLGYGRAYTEDPPVVKALRAILDGETRRREEGRPGAPGGTGTIPPRRT
jgi:putative hydrolases of HD superfamily